MASLFEKKDRHLIPNWRSFVNTAKLGELNGSKGIKLDSSYRPDISDLLDDWNESNSIGVAGDILGVASICNQEDNAVVRNIATYVLENQHLASKAIIDVAHTILTQKGKDIHLDLDINSSSLFNDNSHLLELHIKINSLKRKLGDNPLNPINWVEIARYYSILGQEEKAERAIRNALYLAPENRFILRSVSRFFVHFGDVGFAHDIIRKSTLTEHDPWLLATEVALATLRGRSSRFFNKGVSIVNSGSFHPFNTTELAGSLATLEMKNASFKKSKKLFETSLTNPNDNSLAQAQWASQQERSLMPLNPRSFNPSNSFEALARDFSQKEKWQESVEHSKLWFFDLPFSKRPIMFGMEIASSKLKDHHQAVEIAKLGLLSHPNDGQLLNNIIYSLCLQNKIAEAEKYLLDIKKEDLDIKTVLGICLTATKGLYYFRKGFHDIGRQYYLSSMRSAQEQDLQEVRAISLINYIREEILVGEEDLSEIILQVHKIANHYHNLDLGKDAQEVIDLYNKSHSK
ncbi:hypothetical protein [Daejeonella sp.]|uniref:hypothetical protein n=1 Tax=Daejeonella sp. TaxID=2805397 RepID=UPI002731DD70|nr:hypothetical protein [Daejeonella sp.]MDP2413848.1 hypothetical protein [Daejeonella sp.]